MPGLEGVVAFHTAIAEPDKDGGSLRYRGVDIEDLVGRVGFDDVWGLLVDDAFGSACRSTSRCPRCAPAMSGSTSRPRCRCWRRAGGTRPLLDISDEQARDQLAATTAAALSYVAQVRAGRRPRGTGVAGGRVLDDCRTVPDRMAGRPTPEQIRAIDAYWVSAAEHGMNASTFTARVVASTGADIPACFAGAIGSMSGPLHGGAPARVLPMIQEVERTGDAVGLVKGILDRKEKLMGFGHRVYRAEDPRARVLRRTCRDSAPSATRWPRRWSRRRWPSCGSAARPGHRDQRRVLGAVILDFAGCRRP